MSVLYRQDRNVAFTTVVDWLLIKVYGFHTTLKVNPCVGNRATIWHKITS